MSRSVVALAALVAACAPSTYDNLTGGKKPGPTEFQNTDSDPDPALEGKDPRPIGPFSTAWVNTTKPNFRWELHPGTTGARIEISDTRDFAKLEYFENATGSDHRVNKELAKGVHFWRLQARRDTHPGVSYSPTWELFVRGGGPNGESDTAHGGVFDANGDGIPDLAISYFARWPTETEPNPAPEPDLAIVFGSTSRADAVYDVFTRDPKGARWYQGLGAQGVIVGGVDINGDGFGDFVIGEHFPPQPPEDPEGGVDLFAEFGGPPSNDNITEPSANLHGYIETQAFKALPALAVGDFNGDGFGDVSAAFPNMGVAFNGSQSGPRTLLPFASSPTPHAPAIFGADFDSDGRSDVAFAPLGAGNPFDVYRGQPTTFIPGANLSVGGDDAQTLKKPPPRAVALTTGDFDGDGVDEVAFSTTLDDVNGAICIQPGNSSVMNVYGCWASKLPVAGFGLTLRAGDIDADGIDDLIVASTGNITILKHGGKGFGTPASTFEAVPLVGDYATKLSTNITVMDPGRPKPARWAAYGTGEKDKKLYVFSGMQIAQEHDMLTFKDRLDFDRFGSAIR